MSYISICIPTYEMKGRGVEYLQYSFDVMVGQTFKDFDVVISDHSKNDDIENLCKSYQGRLNIHYYRNTYMLGSSSANANNAIKKATGKLVKILYQDDFLYDANSLQNTVDAFDLEKDYWLVSACEHTKDGKTFYQPFYPKYNHRIHLGRNTISSPSVVTVKNDGPLLLDGSMIWLSDVDYYKRCYRVFGPPKILNKITVVNRVGDHQITNTLATQELRKREYEYEKAKVAGLKRGQNLKLPTVTLVVVSSVKMDLTVECIRKSMKGIEYGRVLLISHERPENLPLGVDFEKCEPIRSIEAYSRFMIYDLARYIHTDFALVAHYNGYVLRPNKWIDDFLTYDYIGAPWPKNTMFDGDRNIRVGNAGFSLRSKKLLNIFNELKIPFDAKGNIFLFDDGMICHYYRKELEAEGIRFAPAKLAALFSGELWCEESVLRPFGYHGNEVFLPFKEWPAAYLDKFLKKAKSKGIIK